MDALLNIENLVIGYGEKRLVSGINLSVGTGKLVAIKGRNGIGKTTLLRCISGLRSPLAGQVLLQGNDIHRMNTLQRSKLVSVMLTDKTIMSGIDVKTLVEMGRFHNAGRFRFSNSKDLAEVNHCLQKMDIEHLADSPLSEISDGELQKAMIARALAQKTPLIVMDEPSSFLDYVAKEDLFVLLKKIAHEDKISIVFSSHDLDMISKYSDEVCELTTDGLIPSQI